MFSFCLSSINAIFLSKVSSELNEKYDRAIIENVRVKAENKKLNNKIRDFKQSMIII